MKMKKYFTMVGVVVLAGAVGAGAVWAKGIQEGQWEMTIVTKVAGMEKEMAEARAAMENMPPEQKAMMEKMMGGMNVSVGAGGEGITMNVTRCISNENPVPDMETEQPDCRVTHTMKGNTVNFETHCPDSHSVGKMVYRDGSMEGTVRSTQTADGQKTEVHMDMTGTYLGPCP